MKALDRRWVWAVMLAALIGAIAVGSWPRSAPMTQAQRVDHIASQIRCPTCNGLSVAESDAPLAMSARDEIARQVGVGNSDDQIKTSFVASYGNTALMTAPRHGITAAAWALPIVFAVLGVAGIAYAVVRWRRSNLANTGPSAEDRALVAQALRSQR